jgi:hypothetical protein
MSVNQTQGPTPEQEAIYERDCEIAALKEQIAEAYRIIGWAAPEMGMQLHFDAVAWLDQNETIAKECSK